MQYDLNKELLKTLPFTILLLMYQKLKNYLIYNY